MSKQEKLFKSKLVPAKKGSGNLFDEEIVFNDGPVKCLGLEFENDDARRAHFTEELRRKLQDPEFRKIEGFPIGEDEDILKLGSGPAAVEIDLMEPIDPEARPRVHKPALNHIGLWIDDLSAAVMWLKEQGVRFTPGGIRKGASGHDVCFIHPKGNEDAPIGGAGVLIELVQAPADVVDALGS